MTNNLATKYPYLANEWNVDKNNGSLPSEFTYGSNKKVWWKCSTCGNEWQATITHRINGRGCPICAKKTWLKNFQKRI